jgi:hypothetical protein
MAAFPQEEPGDPCFPRILRSQVAPDAIYTTNMLAEAARGGTKSSPWWRSAFRSLRIVHHLGRLTVLGCPTLVVFLAEGISELGEQFEHRSFSSAKARTCAVFAHVPSPRQLESNCSARALDTYIRTSERLPRHSHLCQSTARGLRRERLRNAAHGMREDVAWHMEVLRRG